VQGCRDEARLGIAVGFGLLWMAGGAAVMRALRVVVVACLLLLAGPGPARDYWTPLSDADLMREARAAFHLGYLDAEALPTSPTLPVAASLDLVNRLLSRPALSGPLQVKAYRLKLQIFDRRAAFEIASGDDDDACDPRLAAESSRRAGVFAFIREVRARE
jgi:hypothetical protein